MQLFPKGGGGGELKRGGVGGGEQSRKHRIGVKGNPSDRKDSCIFSLLVTPGFGLLPGGATQLRGREGGVTYPEAQRV